jgi:hypothetical protein
MKIFLSFLQSGIDHPIPSYHFWQHYVKNGITEAGHQWQECTDVDWACGLVPASPQAYLRWKEEAWGKTVTWLKEHPADLFLSYLYPDQIDLTAITAIKKMGIPCVNFFCDNVREFRKVPVEFSVFDLNWVPEYQAVKLYEDADYPFINLPMPMWLDPELRVVKPEADRQVTFIGSKDIQRLLFFEEVIRKEPGLPLALYGNGWDENALNRPALLNYGFDQKLLYQYHFIKKQGIAAYWRKLQQSNSLTEASTALSGKIAGVLDFEAYNRLTAQSMITVGINRYPSYHFPLLQPDTYSRLRDMEAPMLGACYLTEYTGGIENMYEPGLEIETYTDAGSFVRKIKELMRDPVKRKNLKLNAQKRALQDHGVPQSIDKILKRLFN